MISLKPGVEAKGVKPETLLGLIVADGVYTAEGVPCVVTSLLDGEHKEGSLHYEGLAADLRTRDFSPDRAALVATVLGQRLGTGYDVVLEKDHIHMEFDPPKPKKEKK